MKNLLAILVRALRSSRGLFGDFAGRFQSVAYSVGYAAGTGSLTWTPNMDNGNVQKRTANASGTLSVPTNAEFGMTIILILTQDATGSRVVTWGAGWHFPGGTEGVLSTAASAIDVLSGVYDGTNWLVALTKDHKA